MVEETERTGEDEVRILDACVSATERRTPRRRHRPMDKRCSRGEMCSTQAASARWPHWASKPSTSTRGRASRSSRPATRSSLPVCRSRPARSTTSIASPRARFSRSMAACRSPYQTAQDTLDDLERAIDRCLDEDVIVFSGGSSVGERDLILDVIGRRGEIVFHGIAREARQAHCVRRSAGQAVFGMPGYPTSCLSNAYMLLVPGAPPNRAPAALPMRHRHDAARPPSRVDDGPASVLHGANHRRRGAPRFQGLRRHHVDVTGRRLHRDPRANRHRRARDAGRSKAFLTAHVTRRTRRIRRMLSAISFQLVTLKTRCARLTPFKNSESSAASPNGDKPRAEGRRFRAQRAWLVNSR